MWVKRLSYEEHFSLYKKVFFEYFNLEDFKIFIHYHDLITTFGDDFDIIPLWGIERMVWCFQLDPLKHFNKEQSTIVSICNMFTGPGCSVLLENWWAMRVYGRNNKVIRKTYGCFMRHIKYKHMEVVNGTQRIYEDADGYTRLLSGDPNQ